MPTDAPPTISHAPAVEQLKAIFVHPDAPPLTPAVVSAIMRYDAALLIAAAGYVDSGCLEKALDELIAIRSHLARVAPGLTNLVRAEAPAANPTPVQMLQPGCIPE